MAKSHTSDKETFIRKAKKIHPNAGFNYEEVDYKNAFTKVKIICPKLNHGAFLQTPKSHLSGHGCDKCGNERMAKSLSSDKETFIKKAKKKHPEAEYIYNEVDYINYNIKVKIICPKLNHGAFLQRPNNHLKGRGCDKCGIERRAKSRSSDTDTFIRKAKEIHPNAGFNYEEVDYIGSDIKVKIICPKLNHGAFLQRPHNHLSKYGCDKCGIERKAKSRSSDTDTFIRKAKKIHPNAGFNYEEVDYIYANTKVKIICPKLNHGAFLQTPSSHLRGNGCDKCGIERMAKSLSSDTDTFIRKAKEIHPNAGFNYEEVNYKNALTKVKIICPKPNHGAFLQTPSGHLNGYGCDKCQYCPKCLLFRTTRGKLCEYCLPKPKNKLYQKTKEFTAVKFLRENCDKEFLHNKTVGSDCTKDDREDSNGHLYPDIRFDCNWFQLIVEIDEFQHRGKDYSCDERRMYDIIAKLGMSCVFIRYNPDNNESNIDSLLEKINGYIELEDKPNSLNEFDEFGLSVKYLFYKD